MEINSLVQTNNIDVLAVVLTHLEQKKLNVLEEILKKFDDMLDDFETNALMRNVEGIHKAGDFCLRMMKWLVSARFYENVNYYDLIGTALRYMKGDKLNVTKELFLSINEWE